MLRRLLPRLKRLHRIYNTRSPTTSFRIAPNARLSTASSAGNVSRAVRLRRTRPPRSARTAPSPTVYIDTNLRIALIGRPNVGKSTLFNRLAGSVRGRGTDGVANPSPLVFVRSVVDSLPGVTRDPRDARASISDLLMTVVDTPGLEAAIGEANTMVHSGPELPLASATAHCEYSAYRKMYRGMENAAVSSVNHANVVFFVIDASEGVTSVDHSIARWLAVNAKGKVLVIANKCDVSGSDKNAMEAYELGLGEPVVISAEHGLGFGDLYTEVDRLYREHHSATSDAIPAVQETSEEEEMRSSFDDELVVGYGPKPGEEPLRQLVVSIIGRPNVGKSTLLNCLVGEQRSLVGPAAGVTRDAVLCEWKIPLGIQRNDNIPVWLVDTAGVRPQVKIEKERLEKLSVRSSLRALRHSHVVLVVVDAREPFSSQDMKLLDAVVTEGRAVLLVVNKMDTIDSERIDMERWRLELRYKIDSKISELAGIEVVEMSALNWEKDPTQQRRLYYAVQRARTRWEKRIPTSALNRFITSFNERMSVGSGVRGERRNRYGVTKFLTQKKIRPPMFRLDGSSAVSMNYVRSLTNAIRKEFGFEGVPIRVKRPSRRKRR